MRVKLTFLGAAREVTGSMLLLETVHGRVLIDCGLFQGHRAEARARNARPPEVAVSADAAILSHAHIDHSGNLPTLVKAGFRGAIHTTSATRDLCASLLRDSAHLQVADAEYLNRRNADQPGFVPIQPLYDEEDAVRALERFVAQPYHRRFSPVPGVDVTLLDAGHILGSASLLIEVDEHGCTPRLLVSGDLGRHGMPMLRDPEPPHGPIDVLVLESTYGNRRHGAPTAMGDELARVIHDAIARGGKLLIPAFAVERTQELLFVLTELRRQGRVPPIPVYIDSPLAIDVTAVFRLHPECFDAESRHRLDRDGDLFGGDALHLTRTREESVAINQVEGPAIIIAASGMCEGGRVLHHLRNLVEDARNTIAVVGFMAQHTLGRRLVERRPKVKIWGVERELHAHVEVLDAFSAHADRDGLLAYAAACHGARRVFLVHGELDQQEPLRAALLAAGAPAVDIPERGEEVVLT